MRVLWLFESWGVGRNSKSVWWTDVVKDAVEKKKAACKKVLGD